MSDERGADGEGDAAGMRRIVLQETLVSVTTGSGDTAVSSTTVTERTDDDDSETRGERRGEARRASSGEETGATGGEKPAKRRKSSSEKGDKEKRRNDEKKSGKRKDDDADLEENRQTKKKAGDDGMKSAAKMVRFMQEEQRKESDDFWGDQTMGEAGDSVYSESRDGRESRDGSGMDAREDLMESAAKTVRRMAEEQQKESDYFWGEQTSDDQRESLDEAERDAETAGKSRRKSKDQTIGGGSKKTKTVKEEVTIEMESETRSDQGEGEEKGDGTSKRKVSKKMTMAVTEEHSSQVESSGDDDARNSKSSSKKNNEIKKKDTESQAEEQQAYNNDKEANTEDFTDKVSKIVKSMYDEQMKESEKFWDDEGNDDANQEKPLKHAKKLGDSAEKASAKEVTDDNFIESVSKTVRSMVDEQEEESQTFWGDGSHEEKKTSKRTKQPKKRNAQTQDDDYAAEDQRSAKKKSGEEIMKKQDVRMKTEAKEQIIDSREFGTQRDDDGSESFKKSKTQRMETKSKERPDMDAQRKDSAKKVKKTVKTMLEEEISEFEDVSEYKPKSEEDDHIDKAKRRKRQDITILHEVKSDADRHGSVTELGDDDTFLKNVSKTVLFMEEEQNKESDDFWGDVKDEDQHPSDIIRKRIEQSTKATDEEDTRHGVKHKREDKSPTDSDDGVDRITKTVKSMKTDTVLTKDAIETDDHLPEGLTPEEVTSGPHEAAMPDQTPQKKPSKGRAQDTPGAEMPSDGGSGPPSTLQLDSAIPTTDWSGDSVFSDQAAQLDAMRRQMQADSDAFWGQDGGECRVQEISSEPWEGGRPGRPTRRLASQQSGIVQEFESDDGGSEPATTAAGDNRHRQTHYQQVITTVIKGGYWRKDFK